MQLQVDEGRKMGLDAEPIPVRLSRRDVQLALLVSRGRINKEIAFTLGITEGTVKIYMSHLFAKLGMGNRAELAAWAVRHCEEIDRCIRAYDEATQGRGPRLAGRTSARAANVAACSGDYRNTDSGKASRVSVCFSCGSVLRPARHHSVPRSTACA